MHCLDNNPAAACASFEDATTVNVSGPAESLIGALEVTAAAAIMARHQQLPYCCPGLW